MTVIGYHCSHEQYAPSQLLQHAKLAAREGFEAAMCSDHFHPWSRRQGQSGFAWSWLGSALEGTPLSFGTVCAPGERYHPAIIAQAAATLADMHPDRFWLAVGSGEALNETITGRPWLPKPQRQQRLKECVDILRALWSGATVNHAGLVQVSNARLHSLPARQPLLLGACLSPETAEWMGGWADGLITVSQDRGRMREIVAAFRAGGGEGKPLALQVVMSFAPSEDEALQAAHDQWRQAALEQDQLANLDSVAAFDHACEKLTHEDVRRSMRISASIDQHLEWLREDEAMGFERLYLHNVHRDQASFLTQFGRQALAAFAG